jgi:hypothetical protein
MHKLHTFFVCAKIANSNHQQIPRDGVSTGPGNPTGRKVGSRNKRTEEIFNRLEARGDLDPADLLSSIVTDQQEPKELRIQAAGLLMPYKYSKMGTTSVVNAPLPPSCCQRADLQHANHLAKIGSRTWSTI